MPEVKPGEKLKSYISRCIPVVMNEDSSMTAKHAAAKCYGLYRQAHKQTKKIAASFGNNIALLVKPHAAWACSDVESARFHKELIKVGSYKKEDMEFTVDQGLIEHWAATGNQMLEDGIKIPVVGSDHVVNESTTHGWVLAFEVEGDSLYADVEIIDESPDKLTATNDISIYSPPDFKAGNGQVYTRPITSVALTPMPVVPGLSEFEALAASFIEEPALEEIGKPGGEMLFSAIIDDKTCEVCKEHNGKTYTLGQVVEMFPEHDAVGPHVHPNCRCTWNGSIAASVVEPAEIKLNESEIMDNTKLATILGLDVAEMTEESVTAKLSEICEKANKVQIMSAEIDSAKVEYDKRILAAQEECDAKVKAATVAIAASQVTALPDERLVKSIHSNTQLRIDSLVRDGNISRAAGEKLKSRLDTGALSLSIQSGQDATIEDVLTILSCSRPVALGEKSQGQILTNPAMMNQPVVKSVHDIAQNYYSK